MKKINFENGQTPASAETMEAFQKNIENAIEERNIITAKISGNSTIAQTNIFQKVDLTEVSKLGDKLSISNGGILIEEGVKNVEVYANVLVNLTNSGTLNVIIQKNNDVTARSINSNVSGNQTGNFKKTISVNQGDILYLYVGANAGDTVNTSERLSWIEVKVLKIEEQETNVE